MYYKKDIDEILGELETDKEGLSADEVEIRLNEYGKNEIVEKKKISAIKILLSQFHSFIVYILLAAIVISAAISEYVDSAVILVILIVNAVVGFLQEYKAEKSIQALKKLASQKAVVIRDGKEKEIESIDIVPGDIIKLETGDKIPADSRLIFSMNLETDESSLTGESVPVKKSIETIDQEVEIGDRLNMTYSSTVVTKGKALAVVTGTGMNTEVGKIAKLIEESENGKTPLQEKLDRLGKWIGNITIGISFIVFIIGVITGEEMLKMFLAAVALAVAAVPEGLAAVVTISLAIGVRRMVKKNALIRTLHSVETLGSTNVICTDKTGTLTKNEMTVKKIYVNNQTIDVSGSGYEPEGDFNIGGEKLSQKQLEETKFLLKIGLMNNDSKIEKGKVRGDPTEAALLVSAAKSGLDREKEEAKNPRIDEIGFDSDRKRMTTIHKNENTQIAYVKGAPDIILNICTKIHEDGKVRKITDKDKKSILKANEKFAGSALRVLGFAYKESKEKLKEDDLIFVGLQAMIDPPREDVRDSIIKCEEAGIRVIMITGDHETTAKAIAEQLDITGDSISGKELDKINDFSEIVNKVSIFARVNPEHKLKIVKALQANGNIVAMTGDGVNDAPALKKSDIGIAMGKVGTDVAKEASDMILLDDHFTSIVNAVEEGRGVYDNIRKFFALLISGNIGEVAIIFFALLFGLSLPLTATMILLINLVTDGLPATALGVDPFEPNAMKRKPRSRQEPIQKGLSAFIFYYPIIMTATILAIFIFIMKSTSNLSHAQTGVFLGIAMFELYQSISARSTRYTAFKVGILKNKWLLAAILSSLLIVIAVIYNPTLQSLFGTYALSIKEFISIALISSIGFIFIEIYKYSRSKKEVLS